jgi:DNA-directed RNA polymerase subunit E'/Rpb7
MSIVNLYRNEIQKACIDLEAFHLNNEILINMINILKKDQEKKCNKNGYIDKIYKIISYSDGKLLPENLNGGVRYIVEYSCKICIPIENTILIAQVKSISQEVIICITGPIIIFVPKEKVDVNIWDIHDNYMNNKSKTRLVNTNLVKILITDKRINNNDHEIKAIGQLLNFPTQKEIDDYYNIIENRNIDNI